jgi:hypothetical protein
MGYGARIQTLLDNTIPLTRGAFQRNAEARTFEAEGAEALFPGARDAQAALSGLLLLLGDWERSHELSQDNPSREGSYWHAIAHRIEPDSSNAGYWFRRVGAHPIFAEIQEKARAILGAHNPGGWRLKPAWDPVAFVAWCDEARARPGGEAEAVAVAIQQAEWRLLFGWCALQSNDLSE